MKTQRKDPGGIVILGALIMGALYLLFVGVHRLLLTMEYIDSALPAMGKIVSHVERAQRKGQSNEWIKIRFPVVIFKSVAGDMVQFQLEPEPSYEVGASLALLYLPNPPYSPVVDTFEFIWQPGASRLGFGLLLLFLSIRLPIWRKTSLLTHYKQNKKRKKR